VRPRSRQAVLAPLALAVLVGAGGCSDSGSPTAPSPPRPAQPAAAKPAVPVPAPAPAPPPYTYAARGRRDPVRPLIAPRVVDTPKKDRPKTGLAALDVKELKLAGIVWGGRGFYALVEAPTGAGYVVRVNDVVGEDARVAKITSEGVTFEVRTSPVPQSQARLVELRLRKEE
jgi:Tfp pilus assembly protein PilP